VSSLVFGWHYRSSKSPIIYWYTLALALSAIGLIGAALVSIPNTVFNWIVRVATYLAGFYFLVGLITTSKVKHETSDNGGVSARWADAFRNDRKQMDIFFGKILNGFAYNKIICDKTGKPADYVFLDVNNRFEKLTGLKREEIVGRRVTSVIPGIEKDPADWIGVYGGVALSQESIKFERYAKHLNKWFSVSSHSPKKGYFVEIFEDITERHKTEESLKRSEWIARRRSEELEEIKAKLEEKAIEVEEYATSMEQLAEQRAEKLRDAERLATIGSTAGMVGHDIRNPLQAIVGNLYLIASDVAYMPEGELKESIGAIRKSVDYINKIVKDLQDFARPLKTNMQKSDFEEICQEVLLEDIFPENIEVKYVIEDEAKFIATDPALLKRILSNLTSNAAQAMPDGGKLIIHARRESDEFFITVQDSGVGIPEEHWNKLFTPLFTTKAKGQGFGLAVIKRLTEALGGTVNFESEKGKGTKFIICLPNAKNE
jgi:PAS domain S-box-containing protein